MIYFIVVIINSSNVMVRPQDIAIPLNSITNDTDGRPILTFYAQLNGDTVVSFHNLTKSVEVRNINVKSNLKVTRFQLL